MSWNRLSEDADQVTRRRPADEVLGAILDWAAGLGKDRPSLAVARLLETLAGERGVRRVLEVGTGLALSTVCLARGAAGAEIVSIVPDESRLDAVAGFLDTAGVAERVRLVSGDLLALVDRFEDRIDLLHLTVEPGLARRLVDRLLPRLEVGGLVTVEGLVPDGDPERDGAHTAKAVSGYLVMHPQLDCTVLPIGRGLAVARKKRPTVTEMGGPF